MVILGIDVGSTQSGWACIDVRGGVRGVPIVSTYDGCGDRASTYDGLAGLIAECQRGRGDVTVAVEVVAGIAYAPKGGGIVSALIASSRAAGLAEGAARAAGARFIGMTAREWRGYVLAKPHASDQEIARAIPGLIHGWPKRSNVHHRDAAGVALAAGWMMAAKGWAA